MIGCFLKIYWLNVYTEIYKYKWKGISSIIRFQHLGKENIDVFVYTHVRVVEDDTWYKTNVTHMFHLQTYWIPCHPLGVFLYFSPRYPIFLWLKSQPVKQYDIMVRIPVSPSLSINIGSLNYWSCTCLRCSDHCPSSRTLYYFVTVIWLNTKLTHLSSSFTRTVPYELKSSLLKPTGSLFLYSVSFLVKLKVRKRKLIFLTSLIYPNFDPSFSHFGQYHCD